MVLLAGCSIGGHRLPEGAYEVPQVWKAQESLTGQVRLSGPGELGRWWEAFGDEELSRLIKKAFEGNPSVKEVLWRIERTRAEKKAELSKLWPEVKLSSSARRQLLDGGTGSTFSAGAEVSWELDLLARLPDRLKVQRVELESVQEEMHGIKSLLAEEVAQKYFEFLASSERLKVLRAYRKG